MFEFKKDNKEGWIIKVNDDKSLHISSLFQNYKGILRYQDGNQKAGRVLTGDNDGYITWQDVSSSSAISLTTIGTSGPSTLIGTILNIPDYSSIPFPGITINNVVFVSKNGNDSTGTVGRLDLPFLTVIAAQNAASAGMLVYVFPGTYTDGNLSKDGVNYYFSDGYIYNGVQDWFGDAVTTTPVTCKISGYARGTKGRMIFSQNVGAVGSIYDIQLRSWISTATSVIACFNGSPITVNALEDLQGSSRVVRYRANLLADNTPTYLKVKCRTMSASCPVLIEPFANKIANVVIDADLVMDPSFGGGIPGGAILINQTGQGNVIHRGNITVLPGVSAHDPILGSNSNPLSTLVSYSDITSTGLQPIFGFGSHLDASGSTVIQYGVKHYGNISHSGQLIFFVSSSVCAIELNGNYTSNIDASLVYPAIETNLTVGSVIQINGSVLNANNDVNAHTISKTAGGDYNLKVLSGTRLITTNLSAYCLTSDTIVPTFNIYPGVTSNVVVDPGIGAVVQQISTVLTDVNVN